MSCRVQNGVAVLPNGKESELFKSLVRATGNIDEATNLYEQVHSKNFTDWYSNWEKNYTPNLFSDENGEPKLVSENGFYSFKNSKGDTWEIALEIKDKSNALNIDREAQADLINTLVGFITKVRGENPNIFKDDRVVEEYFGLGKDTEVKGELANKMLMEAFPGATSEQAQELYNILNSQGAEAMFDALPDNVTLNEAGTDEYVAWEVFTGAYARWNSQTNNVTGNIERVGVRELLKDSLTDYGFRLRDREGEMNELEDTSERIYSMSSFQENPRTKLSSEAKAIIGNIQLEESNIFGYPKLLPISKAYAIMAEATVGEPTYQEMLSKLAFYAQPGYKPEARIILNKLQSAEITAKDEAALFTNFKSAYNNFILFKSEGYTNEETGVVTYENKIFNSNQSQISKKAKERFRENSRERTLINPRAIYKIDPFTGNLIEIKEGVVDRLEKLWTQIDNVKQRKQGVYDVEDINALGEYIWILGMELGPTLLETQQNLQTYYVNGNEEGDAGVVLFDQLVSTPQESFQNFLLALKNGQDIYQTYSSLVNKITEIAPLFNNQPFGSFISGTNKTYYPIGLPSRLTELMSSINNPKESGKTIEILNQFLNGPLFRPYGSIKYSSRLVSILHSDSNARKNFIHEVLDSYKAADEFVATADYDNQSSKISLIERLMGFMNNGNKNFTRVAIPIQAGRESLDFITIPRLTPGVNRADLIRSIIIQDLARIDQANEAIMDAFRKQNPSDLIEGYHYLNPADPYAADGSAFTMTQISELGNPLLKDGSEMSDYTKAYATGVDFLEKDEFEQLLNTKINEVSERLTVYEKRLQDRLKTYNIELLKDVSKDLNTSTKKIDFLNAFVFENFIGKIEISKVLRSGFSFAKNTEGFYKRMALLKTPGNKLFLKGMSEKDPNYGMPETYNAVTIRDFDFVDKGRAIEVAENLERILIGQGVPLKEAVEIATGYTSVNKSDAQSFISLTMYRGIMQGMGQWDDVLDEQAYKNAMDPEVGLYIDENDNPRPIYPLKPFHEEISLQGGVNALFMDKNSYTVVTPELAASYSYLQSMLAAMNKGIDVVNTESATKGARINIQDFQTIGNLDAATPIAMDSNMLRFPQMIPRTKKTDIAFNRQIRKNLVANIQPLGEYTVGNRKMLGSELIKIYQETVAANIAEDTKNINNALGITGLEKLRGKEGTEGYRDAKLNYLRQVRDRIKEQIKERDLPDNYLEALDITPNGMFDWQFKIPLSFPNYQAKFEGIFMSMFHNELFNQKLKGQELVQVAELGGHVVSGELEFYDGSNPAQIRVKASTLGLPANTNAAELRSTNPKRLQVIGYRIPQQGKNSSLFMEVVDFLPESHEKAIMVPGGITLQQGSDFDVDKLNLIFPELDAEGNVIKPDYNKDPVDMDRLERNNVIFNVFNSILMDPKHLKEVVKPLDNNSIKDAREFLADKINLDSTIDYNDPMAELDMEERAKLGSALIGLWSNHLAGRNVAETVKVLEIKASYAPIIDNKTYAALGVTTDSDGNFTDSNISEHLSSAVDYANDPIQLSVNDNIYTNPVLGMFYSAGISIETALNFVNQPIIREVTKYASDNALSIGKFHEAIAFVSAKYGSVKIKGSGELQSESSINTTELKINLETPNPGTQLIYLANFNKFFMAGRALQTVNKIITPDNLDNVTELSSISAWLDTENLYLNNPESLIQNAEEIIQHHKTIKESLSPIASAYRGIFNTIIKETDRIGFLNNKPAFVNFKDELKEALGQSKLTDAQHKLVDRALFLKLITRPHSPFVDNGPINEENFNSMYVNPTNNLITRLQNIREAYPELNNNLFVQALEADPSNKETMLFLLRLSVPMGASTTDKNELSKALLELVESKNEDIRNFGKLLVTNQILTSGFSPTFGSYIDLIPSKILTTSILNPSKQSPVQYFKQESEELMRTNYFDDFVHDFVRTYGLQRPKGVPIVKRINKKLSVDKNGFTTFGLSTPDIYSENGVTLDYFLASYEGKSAIFVHVEGGKYQLLSLLGRSRKLNESGVGPSNSPSLVNSQGTTNKPGPRKVQPVDVITINEDTAVVRTLDNTDCL